MDAERQRADAIAELLTNPMVFHVREKDSRMKKIVICMPFDITEMIANFEYQFYVELRLKYEKFVNSFTLRVTNDMTKTTFNKKFSFQGVGDITRNDIPVVGDEFVVGEHGRTVTLQKKDINYLVNLRAERLLVKYPHALILQYKLQSREAICLAKTYELLAKKYGRDINTPINSWSVICTQAEWNEVMASV